MADALGIRVELQTDPQVGRGKARSTHLRPFDQGDRGAREVLVEACFTPLVARGESIKIKVVQIESREIIRFEQRECRALDAPPVAKRGKQGAREGGLARAQAPR